MVRQPIVRARRPRRFRVTSLRRRSLQHFWLPRLAFAPVGVALLYLGDVVLHWLLYEAWFSKGFAAVLMLAATACVPLVIGIRLWRQREDRRRGIVDAAPAAWFLVPLCCWPVILVFTWLMLRHDVPELRRLLYYGGLVCLISVPGLWALYLTQRFPRPRRHLGRMPGVAWLVLTPYLFLGLFAHAIHIGYGGPNCQPVRSTVIVGAEQTMWDFAVPQARINHQGVDGTIGAIKCLNPGANADQLQPGSRLKLPFQVTAAVITVPARSGALGASPVSRSAQPAVQAASSEPANSTLGGIAIVAVACVVVSFVLRLRRTRRTN